MLAWFFISQQFFLLLERGFVWSWFSRDSPDEEIEEVVNKNRHGQSAMQDQIMDLILIEHLPNPNPYRRMPNPPLKAERTTNVRDSDKNLASCFDKSSHFSHTGNGIANMFKCAAIPNQVKGIGSERH